MVAYTSVASGNWSAASTWTPSGVPGNGDTATVAAAHTVAQDVSVVLGTSPTVASTAQLVLTNYGVITQSPGVRLTLRGDALLEGGTSPQKGKLNFAAGSGVAFDDTASASPGNNPYCIAIHNGYNSINAGLFGGGISGNRAYITSVPGSATGYVVNGVKGTVGRDTWIDVSYVDFSNLGAPGRPAIQFWLTNGDGKTGGGWYSFRLQHCSFNNCARVKSYTTASDLSSFTYSNVTHKNTNDTTPFDVNFVTAFTGGTRLLSGCVFDKQCFFNGIHHLTASGNVFQDTYTLASQAPVGALFSGNTIWNQTWGNAAGDGSPSGQIGAMWYWGMTLDHNYYCYDRPGYINPHFLDTATGTGTGATVFSSNVFEFTGADCNGDAIMIKPAASGNAAANTLTISRNIVIPCASGGQSCVLITDFGGASNSASCNYSITMDSNTAQSQGVQAEGACNINENYDGLPNQYTSVRSNLFYNTVPLSGSTVQYALFNESPLHTTPTIAATDEIPSSVLDYNGMWNMSAGTCTVAGGNVSTAGYKNFVFSSGAPGAHDVAVSNPNFVDASRNAAKWAASLGLAQTSTAARTALAAMNDDIGAIAGATPAALLAYVQSGFAPQVSALKGAGFGGVDIGAVGVALPPALTVASITASPGTGDLPVGAIVTVTVNLSGAAALTGTPSATLNDGGSAAFVSASGSQLVFRTTVLAGQSAASLQVASIVLNGGSLKDTYGQAVNITSLPALTPSPQIDGIAPAPATLTWSPASGTLGSGAALGLTVTWSEAVAFTGAPQVALPGLGVNAYYNSSASTPTASVFTATVPPGKTQSLVSAASVISLNGGTILDLAGNAPSSLALPTAPSAPGVDSVAPVVSSVSVAGSGALGVGAAVQVTVTFTKAVTVTGSGLSLATTASGLSLAYASGSGTAALVFSGTVGVGQTTSGACLGVAAVVVGSATVKDGPGNAAVLSGLVGTPAAGPTVDAVPGTVVGVSCTPSTAVLTAGQTAVIITATSKPMTVIGTPLLTLDPTGAVAVYDPVSSTPSALHWVYTVSAGDVSADLSVTGVNIAGATVKDAAGNLADMSGAVGNPTGILRVSAVGVLTGGRKVSSLPIATLALSDSVSLVVVVGGVTKRIVVTGAALKAAFGI